MPTREKGIDVLLLIATVSGRAKGGVYSLPDEVVQHYALINFGLIEKAAITVDKVFQDTRIATGSRLCYPYSPTETPFSRSLK